MAAVLTGSLTTPGVCLMVKVPGASVKMGFRPAGTGPAGVPLVMRTSHAPADRAQARGLDPEMLRVLTERVCGVRLE